ncbi:MAG TPA: serine hydrolase [Allosphingosinicella sp.]|nr:serine hydrolase [Allosphingosinicella sp.]
MATRALWAALLLLPGIVAPAAAQPASRAVAPAGLDQAMLAALARDIAAGRYGNIHALVVMRRGRLAYEHYFTGPDERRGTPVGTVVFGPDVPHDCRSVTKSIVSILFGIAVAEGRIRDLDAPVLDHFPEYADLRTPERLAISVRHVLAMSAGWAWDESSRPYGDPTNSETAMDAAPDRARYVLERPLESPPGARWTYNGGATLLLAEIVERATGTDIETYADRVLFRPLGIARHEWLRYTNGKAIAASGLRLTPRAIALIGQLYLQRGRWHGRQLVPEAWVTASLAPQVSIADRPVGLQRYGYQWYLGTARLGARSLAYSAAIGWGGQRLVILPELDLVMVLTAGLYANPAQGGIAFEILLDRVLPAVR